MSAGEVLRGELARVAERLGAPAAEFVLERPREGGHGDLATNLALVLAKPLKASPRALAARVLAELRLPPGVVERTEVAGPGFINFWLAQDALAHTIRRILESGRAYGQSDFGVGLRVNVEFVSANPTGPLHVGHGRGAAYGDAVASLLEWTGHSVTREFYINDAGAQIDKLALSLWARVQQALGRRAEIPEGGYHGVYLQEAAEQVLREKGRDFADLPAEEGVRQCRALALRMQRLEQDRDLADFGVHFDVHTSEQSLYDRGLVDETLVLLAEKGLSYERDGALWLRTTLFGDDKDRVLRKSDATLTYLVPDIAYHVNKRARGFDRVFDVWGADHHGYVPRMRSVLSALGYPPEFFEVGLIQLVKVVRGGEEVKMSKRSGEFVTLRDLIDEVGTDATRYFFLMRRHDSPLPFDVDLAKKQTDENPVFYVQMAHARLSGIFRTAGRAPDTVTGELDPAALPAPQDVELLKKLAVLPEVVEKAAREREPHRITAYLEELATLVHGWYHHTRAVGAPEGPATEQARLLLARAARIVLANALSILGISAPDRM
ncbi:MAG TPA: arginine--tRNA ligase [Gemmatimonadales bacterium]|nr:arginine--tRNA ligase [Gemmatimonadales bacterium]